MIESILSISPPLDEDVVVRTETVDDGTTISSEDPLNDPENENRDAPLPSFPSVTI